MSIPPEPVSVCSIEYRQLQLLIDEIGQLNDRLIDLFGPLIELMTTLVSRTDWPKQVICSKLSQQ